MFTFNELKGISAGEWVSVLSDGNKKVDSFSTDSRKDCSNSIFVAIKGESFDGHGFVGDAIRAGASAVCVSKESIKTLQFPQGYPVLVVDDTLLAYQKLAKFHRKRLKNLTIIALTGSSGKTSVKEILKTLLSSAFGENRVYATQGNTNNHVGVPWNLLNLNENHKLAIIEMGTNHPGEIDALTGIAEPDMGIVVSIGNAHLEFFGDTNGVAKEKSAIFAKMNRNGIAIIPFECPGKAILENAAYKFKKLQFGTMKDGKQPDLAVKYLGGNLKGASFELFWKDCGIRKIVNWPVAGKHQAFNASAAALAATALGVSPEIIAAALAACHLPGMRMRATEKNGTTWINDAYNANPDSARAGIEWLSEFADSKMLLVILGDMLELGKSGEKAHSDILSFTIKKLPDSAIFAVGPLMTKAVKNLNNKQNCEIRSFPNSVEASAHIREMLQSRKMIYLKGSRGMALEEIEKRNG